MQIKFRLTDSEYFESRRKSNLLGNVGWRYVGIELLGIIPSGILIWLTGIWIAQISYCAVFLIMLVVVLKRIFAKTAVGNQHEHTLTLNDVSHHVQTANSEFEVNWNQFDEAIEDDKAFHLWRLGRCALLPKRVIPDDQMEQFREFISNIKTEPVVGPQAIPQAVSLYTRLFSNLPSGESMAFAGRPALSNHSRIRKFNFIREDIYNASVEPLRVFDTTLAPLPAANKKASDFARRQKFGKIFLGLVFLIAIPAAIFHFASSTMSWINITLILAAVAMPFVMTWLLGLIMKNRFKQPIPIIPPEQFELRLLPNGWAMGTRDFTFFYDWRDVECIYENSFCVGFKTVTDLIQVIPKRIFAEGEASVFMQTATEMKIEHLKNIERDAASADRAPAIGAETGNPFQPPAS